MTGCRGLGLRRAVVWLTTGAIVATGLAIVDVGRASALPPPQAFTITAAVPPPPPPLVLQQEQQVGQPVKTISTQYPDGTIISIAKELNSGYFPDTIVTTQPTDPSILGPAGSTEVIASGSISVNASFNPVTQSYGPNYAAALPQDSVRAYGNAPCPDEPNSIFKFCPIPNFVPSPGQSGAGLIEDGSIGALRRLERAAMAEVARATGVPNDSRVRVWARAEVRAAMWARMLSIVDTAANKRSSDDQAIYEWLARILPNTNTAVAEAGLDQFYQWKADPCGYTPPPAPAGADASYGVYLKDQSCDGFAHHPVTQVLDFLDHGPSKEQFQAYGAAVVLNSTRTDPYLTTLLSEAAMGQWALSGSMIADSAAGLVSLGGYPYYVEHARLAARNANLGKLDTSAAAKPVIKAVTRSLNEVRTFSIATDTTAGIKVASVAARSFGQILGPLSLVIDILTTIIDIVLAAIDISNEANRETALAADLATAQALPIPSLTTLTDDDKASLFARTMEQTLPEQLPQLQPAATLPNFPGNRAFVVRRADGTGLPKMVYPLPGVWVRGIDGNLAKVDIYRDGAWYVLRYADGRWEYRQRVRQVNLALWQNAPGVGQAAFAAACGAGAQDETTLRTCVAANFPDTSVNLVGGLLGVAGDPTGTPTSGDQVTADSKPLNYPTVDEDGRIWAPMEITTPDGLGINTPSATMEVSDIDNIISLHPSVTPGTLTTDRPVGLGLSPLMPYSGFDLTGATISWSEDDRPLGTGLIINQLFPAGSHYVTATLVQNGVTAHETISFRVVPVAPKTTMEATNPYLEDGQIIGVRGTVSTADTITVTVTYNHGGIDFVFPVRSDGPLRYGTPSDFVQLTKVSDPPAPGGLTVWAVTSSFAALGLLTPDTVSVSVKGDTQPEAPVPSPWTFHKRTADAVTITSPNAQSVVAVGGAPLALRATTSSGRPISRFRVLSGDCEVANGSTGSRLTANSQKPCVIGAERDGDNTVGAAAATITVFPVAVSTVVVDGFVDTRTSGTTAPSQQLTVAPIRLHASTTAISSSGAVPPTVTFNLDSAGGICRIVNDPALGWLAYLDNPGICRFHADHAAVRGYSRGDWATSFTVTKIQPVLRVGATTPFYTGAAKTLPVTPVRSVSNEPLVAAGAPSPVTATYSGACTQAPIQPFTGDCVVSLAMPETATTFAARLVDRVRVDLVPTDLELTTVPAPAPTVRLHAELRTFAQVVVTGLTVEFFDRTAGAPGVSLGSATFDGDGIAELDTNSLTAASSDVVAVFAGQGPLLDSQALVRVRSNPVLLIEGTFADGVFGAAYDSSITLSGVPAGQPLSVQVIAGSLPPGLNLQGGPRNQLVGRPTAAGTYTFTLETREGTPEGNDRKEFTITIAQGGAKLFVLRAPTGGAYDQAWNANGSYVPSLVIESSVAGGGLVPRGTVTFLDNGVELQTVTITPASTTALGANVTGTGVTLAVGPHTITARYNGSANSTPAETSVTFDAAVPPTSTGSPTAMTVGRAALFAFGLTGTNPGITTRSGVLPAGVSLSVDGVLSGTPTQVGSFPVRLFVANRAGFQNRDVTVVVNGLATTTSLTAAPLTANVGQPITLTSTVAAVGGGAPPSGTVVFTVAGNPIGTAPVDDTGAATLAISALPVGTATVVATFAPALAAVGASVSGAVTVTVVALAINGTLPDGSFGVAYSAQLELAGAGTKTITVTSGALPTGLTLSAAGLVSGVPTKVGTSTFALTLRSGVATVARNFTVVIAAATPGAPRNLAVVRIGRTALTAWQAPTSSGGSPITGYVVTVKSGTTVLQTQTRPANPTVYLVSGLPNAGTLTFEVAAVNAVGAGPVATKQR